MALKRLVFLAGSFHPDFSAVGYCAYQVQKCLVGDFDITVVAFRSREDQPREDDLGRIKIRRIETRDMARRNRVASRKGVKARGGLLALRLWGALKRVVAPETIDASLVQAYLTALEGLDEPPDAVVPLVFPFESVIAALNYKAAHPGVMVLPYLFDDFVDSGSLHVFPVLRYIRRQRHLALERRMLEDSDAVLSMHPLKDHFTSNFEERLVDRITFVEHPLLVPPPVQTPKLSHELVRLCFTGSLIRNVRPPDYLLDLLRLLQPSSPIRADFYVMGSDARKVRGDTKNRLVQIVNHGAVAKIVADDAVRNSNILVNIGDLQGKQVASKVFEYMSTGKPILHLSYIPGDAVTRILSRYPLALCLEADPDRLDENALSLAQFIDENKSSSIPFAEVAALYNDALPSSTARTFRSLLGARISDRSSVRHA